MIKKIIVGLLLSILPFLLFSQNEKLEKEKLKYTPKKALIKTTTKSSRDVSKVIHQLFDGMRLGDSSMVRSCFYSEVEMLTSFTDRDGNSKLEKGNLKEFINAVGTPHDEVWNEKLFDMTIRIDDNLAQVWTGYSFFVDDKFSHCGVDAFHLVKTKDGWKIFHLTDTRRREGCGDGK